MKRLTKKWLINLAILLVILLIAFLILDKPKPETSEEIAKCIGKNSVLYTQLGCHACETQKEIFGDNYQYLEVIDCYFEYEKCSEVTATPTWKIKGNYHKGVQSIEKLKELTGC